MFSCVVLFTASGIIAATAEKIPDEIVINGTAYKKDIKGPVDFNHGKHAKEMKIPCTECHHEYKDGKNVWVEGQPVKKCVECHNPDKSEGNVKKLMLAYHKNCQGCHKKEKGKEGVNPPSNKCENCHIDEKKAK